VNKGHSVSCPPPDPQHPFDPTVCLIEIHEDDDIPNKTIVRRGCDIFRHVELIGLCSVNEAGSTLCACANKDDCNKDQLYGMPPRPTQTTESGKGDSARANGKPDGGIMILGMVMLVGYPINFKL